MGYKNPIQDITTEWFNLLDGVISVPVYKETVLPSENGNYVVIRAEGQTTTKNHSGFFTNAVIIVEVVTKFSQAVDTSVCDDIDNEITELVFPTPNTFGIGNTTNHQITDINLQSASYLSEDDGTKKYYTKISRYEHSINQN